MTSQARENVDNHGKGQRVQRPNYARIHTRPLPLQIHSLPPLIPHNPISILSFLATYINQIVRRRSSEIKPRAKGYFSPNTSSVHVTDPQSIRLLWECGFFGAGNLSRSEPTWLDRENQRLGLAAVDASENHTRKRREERRQMKLERARLQSEMVEAQRLKEAGKSRDSDTATEPGRLGKTHIAEKQSRTAESDDTNLQEHVISSEQAKTLPITDSKEPGDRGHLAAKPERVVQQEHLQLTREEAFFLHYALDALDVVSLVDDVSMTSTQLLQQCRLHSTFPPQSPDKLDTTDSFLLSYAVYHHYRSLGWVVRPGIKFAVDWLLYIRGPAFSHAEFAVKIMPSFKHPAWRNTHERRQKSEAREIRDWWWLHCLQRVQAQVRKGLVICWVDIPPPDVFNATFARGEDGMARGSLRDSSKINDLNIPALLGQYKVHDMVVKRWIPNRSRD